MLMQRQLGRSRMWRILGRSGRSVGALVAVGVLVAVWTVPASADTGSSTVGLTPKSITISVVGTFSGPEAAIFEQEYKAGALTWRDEVNAAGGIYGRKVVLKPVDDQGTPEGGVAACKAIESNGSFAAFTESTVNQTLTCLNQAGIPAYQEVLQAESALKDVRYGASDYGPYGQAATLAQWVAGKQGLNRAGHKIGVMYLTDIQYFDTQGIAFVSSAKAIGLKVDVQPITSTQTSYTAQLQQFKNDGVDTVVMILVEPSIGILSGAAAIDFKPVWTGTPFDADELSTVVPQPFQGIKSVRYWASTNVAAFKVFAAKVAQYGEAKNPTSTNALGYASLQVMQKALELAGPNPTRQGFLAAFNEIHNFNTGILPPLTFGPGKKVGSNASFPIVCCNANNTWKGLGPASASF